MNETKGGEARPETVTPEPHVGETLVPKDLTPEKGAFIEEKTKELFAYTLDCLDEHKKEGHNILQWVFAVVIGGLGLFGTLFKSGYWPVAIGPLAAAAWSTRIAIRLLKAMHAQPTMPPGNLAANLSDRPQESVHQMRWRETIRLDDRIHHNIALGGERTAALDEARTWFAWLPGVFVGGVIAGFAADGIWRTLVYVFTTRSPM